MMGDENKDSSVTAQESALEMSAEPSQAPDETMATTSGHTNAKDYLKAIGMDPSRFWPKKYRFTREKPTGRYNPLTIAQRNFYETNGYIVFGDCVDKKLLESIRAQYKTASMVEDALMDRLLMKNDKLLQYVKCFCDDRLMLMTHRLLDSFQEEGMAMRDVIDSRHQQRQLLSRDWMFLPFRPIDKVCCAVTAIEPLEHVLLVVPGTHRIGQCSISSTLDSEQSLPDIYDSSQERAIQSREIFECSPERLSTLVDKSSKGFKYIDLKPGQTLFYHPGLIHGFNNDLINFRKQQLVSIAYYAAADCEYVALNKPQEDPRIPIGLAHFRTDQNPIDYTSWLDKPRLLRNRESNL